MDLDTNLDFQDYIIYNTGLLSLMAHLIFSVNRQNKLQNKEAVLVDTFLFVLTCIFRVTLTVYIQYLIGAFPTVSKTTWPLIRGDLQINMILLLDVVFHIFDRKLQGNSYDERNKWHFQVKEFKTRKARHFPHCRGNL